MSEISPPADLLYTPEHEWVQRTAPTTVRVGITDYAQGQLGDVVFVQLPAIGDEVTAGSSMGEVESAQALDESVAQMLDADGYAGITAG